MLRKKIRILVTDKKHRAGIRAFMRALIVICVVWLVSFPYMSRGVFTSENALSGRTMETEFYKEAGPGYSVYKRI